MTTSPPPRGHAAYHDLLRLLQDDAATEILGNPHKVIRNGRGYWYDMYRIGTAVKNRYLGEDSPELAARVARHFELASASKSRSAQCSRLIRVLRAEGMTAANRETGTLLAALDKSGVFRCGGTIVGTHAFRLYEAELGLRCTAADLAQTAEIATFEPLSLALAEPVEDALAAAFHNLTFAPLAATSDTSVWRWTQASTTDASVEFLTPALHSEDGMRPLPALGVAAQTQQYLDYLIAAPIKAAVLYRSGILVQIPRPERFAIHKLIEAHRRQGGPDQIKSIKDRAQAALLIKALAQDRPGDLLESYAQARALHPEADAHITASLGQMPETAVLLAQIKQPAPRRVRSPPLPQPAAPISQFSFDF